MRGDEAAVLAVAAGAIGFIYWFFLGKKDEDRGQIVTSADITVAGGYSPGTVRIPAGKPVTLTFRRTDPTDCLEEIVIPDLAIKRTLPLNEGVEIKLTAPRAGTYPWHCGMNMYHGRLVAV